MKNIIISADGDKMVYAVPDIVADNLEEYCLKFCSEWLRTSIHAEKYRLMVNGTVCYSYTEADFIAYLNQFIFPEEQSVLVENLGYIDDNQLLPEQYRDCPCFDF